MRTVRFAGQQFHAEIVSLCRSEAPTEPHRSATQLPQDEARIALLAPLEIPVGATFYLENADQQPICARSMGGAKTPAGQFLTVAAVQF